MATGFAFEITFSHFSQVLVVRTCYWTVLMLGSKAQSMSPMSLAHLVIGFKGLLTPVALSIHLSLKSCVPGGPVHLPGVLFLQVSLASSGSLQNTIRCQTQGLSTAIPVILL